MWNSIASVSTGFALAAFLAAVAAWIIKAKSEENGNLISKADNNTKARLVQDALEFFHVDSENLTKEQQYSIVMEQIGNRAKKFRILAILIAFISLVAAMLAAFSIYASQPVNGVKATPKEIEDPCAVELDQRPIECILKQKED